ncbi:hypothetical protein MKW92_004097 [Papaver armeniacum]|nr:hypothetical protein MKW92_004097 [Papaver armeniacum]
MTSQVTCKLQKVGSSTTHDTLKRLRSLDEGKTKELDFMSTNDVTSVDMVIIDEQGEELHVFIPKNLIWKFEKQIWEGCLYSMQKSHLTTSKPKFRPGHNEKRGLFVMMYFTWPKFSSTSVIHPFWVYWPLQPFDADVVGFLKQSPTSRLLQRSGGQSSRMGTTMKISLWGSAANQVGNDPIDCDSIPRPVLVFVCSTFVKNYQESNSGRITLPSTNATKVDMDVDIPKLLKCEKARPSRHITVLIKKGKVLYISIHDNEENNISGALAKWDPTRYCIPTFSMFIIYMQAANVLICSATATHVLIENGCHYLACLRCSKKVMGDDGDLWCTKCESKVEMPIAR